MFKKNITYKKKRHDDERITIGEHEVKIIARLLQTLELDIRTQVEAKFEDWMDNPNILAVMSYIDELFYIGHFNGRREEFTQQVEEAMSQIYTQVRLRITYISKTNVN